MLYLSPGITMYILTLAFILGAVFASFLGCMGWRISKGESVLKGRSHCDSCGHTLRWRDLIPIISYIARKGRCAYCGQPISKITVLGELLLGIVFVLTTIRFDVSLELVLMLIFICILYLVSLIDIYERIIPDSILLVAVGVRVLWFLLVETFTWEGMLALFIDGLSISLPLLLLTLLMERILKKEAMGGGDIKLLFVIGLFIGWQNTLLAILFACIIGIIGGSIQMRKSEEIYFAFGPYLAVAAVIALLIGDGLIEWYMSLWF